MVSKQVLAEYERAGIDYNMKAEDKISKAFYDWMTGREDEIETVVDQIYRYRSPKGEEFLYYQVTKRGTDTIGNPIRCHELVGKEEMPTFRKGIDPSTGQPVTTDINFKTVYSVPFSKEKIDEISQHANENISCVIVNGALKYGGFSLDDLKEYSFQDLVTFGRTGSMPVKKQQDEPTKTNRKASSG